MTPDRLSFLLTPTIIPPVLSLVIGVSLAVIAIFKGRFRQENLLFGLVLLWWTMMAPLFILHHVLRGDLETIIGIERRVHFFYAILQPLNVAYYLKMFNYRWKLATGLSVIFCIAIALTTQSDLYFNGMYTYSWGYIAKGGIAFQVFGLYAILQTSFFTFLFARGIIREKNSILKLKYKYITISFSVIAILTLMNIPAMNGIDFYAFSNFMFIPLSIMAYGILRYRLMDIRTIIHVTVIWAVISSLIVIPNIVIFFFLYPFMRGMHPASIFGVMLALFILNYLYIRKVQPAIDQLFNKRRFDLNALAARFVHNISSLKSLDDLKREFADIIGMTLTYRTVEIAVQRDDSACFISAGGDELCLPDGAAALFLEGNHLVDRDMVESNPEYGETRALYLAVFREFTCDIIIPFIQNNELLAFGCLTERQNLKQLSRDEFTFINNIRSAVAIALANSIMYNNLSNLKDNLERKVAERTADLQKAMNALWGEMSLAKKIQTVLLPRSPAMDGYEIAAYMAPADQVGGDYYDIINVEGLDWIVIGDVSGHGVPAGLIMMMVQTSIQVTLHHNPGLNPSELLSIINHTITRNIRQLSEDKYMTITVLAAHRDGRFSFSGLHQDIMIYRAGMRSVELIETGGMWIGIVDEIGPLVTDSALVLNVGDVMLLYTDGITEAWLKGSVRNQRDPETAMFGSDRLVSVFREHGSASPLEIRESIISELGDYLCTDDVTLVVVKRLH